MKIPVSISIPTKDRPEDLKRCVQSILLQSVLPNEVIIIDDGNLTKIEYKKMIEPFTSFTYIKKKTPSLSSSKNLIKNIAVNDLIIILDDDVVLEKEFIKSIYNIFIGDSYNTIGIVSGTVINKKKRTKFEQIYKRVFCLDLQVPGKVLPWGFQTGFDNIEGIIEVDWVSGGTTCYRKEVLEAFSFEEFFGGRSALEDVDFCLKAGKKYKICMTSAAKLFHYQSKIGREKLFITGFKQAFNRYLLFKKYCIVNCKNIVLFYWAMIGNILGMIGKGKPQFALGNIYGIYCSFKKNKKL
ncbi:glycosyltransferase family 2 protein [Chlamydiota bacterium]